MELRLLYIHVYIFVLSFLKGFLFFFLHGVLSNTNNFSNESFWLIDKTLTGTITLGQSGNGSTGNDKVFHTLQISRTGGSLSDTV